MKWLQRIRDNILRRLLPREEPLSPPESYYLPVKQAWQEWQDAKQRFNQVSDPGMVDYAVYSLQAAERRYIYLLQKAREESSPPLKDDKGLALEKK